MSVPASDISVIPPQGYQSTNLQDLLYEMAGGLDYAKSAAGSADAKADNTQGQLNSLKGTIEGYVAPLAGKLDAEMGQVFATLNLART